MVVTAGLPGHRNRVLFVLRTIVPILILGQGLFTPVLPVHGQSFEVGAATVGSLVTTFGVGRLITGAPAGH